MCSCVCLCGINRISYLNIVSYGEFYNSLIAYLEVLVLTILNSWSSLLILLRFLSVLSSHSFVICFVIWFGNACYKFLNTYIETRKEIQIKKHSFYRLQFCIPSSYCCLDVKVKWFCRIRRYICDLFDLWLCWT